MLQARTIDHHPLALGMQVPEGNVFGNPGSETFREMAGSSSTVSFYDLARSRSMVPLDASERERAPVRIGPLHDIGAAAQ